MVRGFSSVLVVLLSLQFSQNGFAFQLGQLNFDQTSCFPTTNLKNFELQGFTGSTGIDEQAFNGVLDRVAEAYEPIFAQQGLQLTIIRLWDNSTVNAGALPNPENPSERLIAMFGGMARHEKMTADGFALVACHEIGHHLGGAPKKEDFRFLWASGEGQSDYFATLKCARKVFGKDNNVALMKDKQLPPLALQKCRQNFSNAEEVALCTRSAVASQVMGDVGMALLKEQIRVQRPDFDLNSIPAPLHETPDRRAVASTSHDHPLPQCRLDTYFQGALCKANHNTELSNVEAESGACSARQGDVDGLRPLCWYKPSVDVNITQN